ncbi:MAG: hypothetical protein JW827_04200 [Spirochaetes bacterium]|nr:hypothetical protein [Spirochaetota bacterium]
MKKLAILLNLLIIPVLSFAGFVHTFDFLNIPESGINEIASTSGLATYNGIASVFGNPAGFAEANSRGIILSDTENIGDTRKLSVFYGAPARYFNFIAGVKYFYMKDSIQYNNSDLDYNSYSVNLLLARILPFAKKLNFGLNIDYTGSSLADSSSSLLLFHTGFLYHLGLPVIAGLKDKNNVGLGVGLRNLGFSLQSYNKDETVPLTVNTGLKYRFINFNKFATSFYVNYSYNTVGEQYPAFSMVFDLFRMLSLSAAYKMNDSVNPLSMGVGVDLSYQKLSYGFYYSIMPVSDFSFVHTISLVIGRK